MRRARCTARSDAPERLHPMPVCMAYMSQVHMDQHCAERTPPSLLAGIVLC
jgi:hypothetical protein